ncbi:hypothetical protein C8R48DRAFT_542078, partial [Suillus tomentosus]
DEEESTRKEKKKKHKHKYTPIQASGGKYIELWYFTNDGLDNAHTKKTIIEDDAMVLSTLPDGLTAWVSAALPHNTFFIINNEDISFEDFCQACLRFITAIEEADWPVDHVRMLAIFWKNLQVHKFHSIQDPIVQKDLLTYQ